MTTLTPLPETETNPDFVNPVKGDPTLSIPRAIVSSVPRLGTPDLPIDEVAINRLYPAPEPTIRIVEPEITKPVVPDVDISTPVVPDTPDLRPNNIAPEAPRTTFAAAADIPPTILGRVTTPITTRIEGLRTPPALDFNDAAINSFYPTPEPTRIIATPDPARLPSVDEITTVFAVDTPPVTPAGTIAEGPPNRTYSALDTDGRVHDLGTLRLSGDELPSLAKTPTIDPPGGLSKFLGGAGRLGRGFLRALPWIGAGVAGAEVGYLSSNHEFLKSADLLPEEASLMLTTLYAGHILQSGVDPSMFGGEFGTRALAEHLEETYDIDPVTMGMIKPGLVIDWLAGNDLSIEEYNRVVEMFTEERLVEMYSSVAEAHGLPQTVAVNINGEEQNIFHRYRNARSRPGRHDCRQLR